MIVAIIKSIANKFNSFINIFQSLTSIGFCDWRFYASSFDNPQQKSVFNKRSN